MNPSTSLGTRSNVGMAKPSPPVRQAGNIWRLLVIHRVCRRSVPRGCPQVKYRCRCRGMLRKKWQWHLLTLLRQTVKTPEIRRLIATCYTRYREGFVTNVQKGEVPTRYPSLARYLAKYVVSPPISLRRIDRYDGQRVTYHYRSHKS